MQESANQMGIVDEADIRDRLGLEEPRKYRVTAIREHLDPNRLRTIHPDKWDEALYRQTGRSTQMLVKAMVQLSKGKKVLIRAETPQMEDVLVQKARHMAYQLNLDPERIHKAQKWDESWYVAKDHALP